MRPRNLEISSVMPINKLNEWIVMLSDIKRQYAKGIRGFPQFSSG